jgi:hypothetical protein
MALLEFEPGAVRLRLATPRTVEFFEALARTYSDGDVSTVAGLACQVVDAAVDSLSRFSRLAESASGSAATAAESATRDVLADLLRGLESRQTALISSLMASLDRDVKQQIGTLTQSVQQGMLQLLSMVESSLRLSADSAQRLSAEAVAAQVAACLAEGHRSLGDLVREELRRATEPMSLRHEQVVATLGLLPGQAAALVHAARHDADASRALDARLHELRARLDDLEAARLRELGDARVQLNDIQRRLEHALGAGPESTGAALRGAVREVVVDAVRDLERESALVRTAVGGAQERLERLQERLSEVLSTSHGHTALLQGVSEKLVADRTAARHSQRVKGQQGESRLFELLSERLTSRDGYALEMVNGQAHSCDICVRRVGHPDVRIESKAHGEQTGEKVRNKEVERFRSDLLGLSAHGIFVSLHSGIVGKGELELEQLSNGKFAFYLSNNNYDVSVIHDVVALVHRLDEVLARHDGDDGSLIRVRAETMKRCQLHLKDFSGRVASAKTHLREALNLLSELTFDTIERELLGAPQHHHQQQQQQQQQGSVEPRKAAGPRKPPRRRGAAAAAADAAPGSELREKITCEACDQRFTSKRTYDIHVRHRHAQ